MFPKAEEAKIELLEDRGWILNLYGAWNLYIPWSNRIILFVIFMPIQAFTWGVPKIWNNWKYYPAFFMSLIGLLAMLVVTIAEPFMLAITYILLMLVGFPYWNVIYWKRKY